MKLALHFFNLLVLIILLLRLFHKLLISFESLLHPLFLLLQLHDAVHGRCNIAINPLQLGSLHEEGILILSLASQELLGFFLIQNGHRVLHLGVDLVQKFV